MNNPKILAVDDEENFLKLLSRTLRKEGYVVRTAKDGREALKILERERFDLALVDIRMTPVNGLIVLEKIKAAYPLTKVIIMTAYHSTEMQALSRLKGADQYLLKPIEIKELKEKVRALLSNLDNTPGEV